MAAKAELRAFLGINSKQFEKGLAKARSQANDFAKKGMMVAGAAVVTFGAALAAGTRRTFAAGAALEHVRQQTGLGIRANMVLSRTFKDAGVSASDLGRRVSEMQRNLVDAERGTGKTAEGLNAIGLSAADLLRLSPDEQMKAIAVALSKIEDPARRSAAAIAIMGTRGANLIKSMNPEALEDARKSLGKMPEIMERFGAAMERADTLMGGLPDKANQFFTGFASEVVGSILDPLERANSMDFTMLGQRLGAAIAPWLEAIQGGEAWDLFVVNGMRAIGHIGGGMLDFFGDALAKGTGALIGSLDWAAVSFGNILIEGIAKGGDAINALLAKLPDFMGIDRRVDTDAIRKDKIEIGSFGETVQQGMDDAPKSVAQKWANEFWGKASDLLMEEPRMRAANNKALAEARGAGSGTFGDGILNGKHDDLLNRKTAFDGMDLSNKTKVAAEAIEADPAVVEKTRFMDLARNDFEGRTVAGREARDRLIKSGDLSSNEFDRIQQLVASPKTKGDKITEPEYRSPIEDKIAKAKMAFDAPPEGQIDTIYPTDKIAKIDGSERAERQEREAATQSPAVALLERLVASVARMETELFGGATA